MIAVAAPLICFYFLLCIARSVDLDFRTAILSAAVAWGVILTGLTELLGAFHLLTYTGVVSAWSIIGLATFALILPRLAAQGGGHLFRMRNSLRNVTVSERWLLAGVAGVLVAAGLTGLIAAPANWDSMTYHLSRVMHWMQNRSVAHYQTNCLRQLYQNPWAEFAILHLQILSGGDRFAFGVQWFALAVSLLGVSAIAQLLGADTRGQILAVVFAATLPASVLQAESTQNNLVVSAWLVCAICFLLRFARSKPQNRMPWGLGFGAAIGLAVLTKGTAYTLAFPLVVWFSVLALRGGVRGSTAAVLAALVVGLLNVGYLARNFRSFGSPLMPASELSLYTTDAMSPRLLASNLLRNLAMQLGTPSQSFNGWLQQTLVTAHKWLGLNVDDPRITAGLKFKVLPFSVDEDFAGNPLHLGLIALALLWAARSAFARSKVAGAGILLLVTMASFILSCATLKWQPFNNRLYLPLFVLAAAPVGIMLSAPRFRSAGPWIGASLLLLTFPYLHENPSHPWFGHHSIFLTPREDQYFLNNKGLLGPYRQAANYLGTSGCNSIGLLAGSDDWEYPLWVMLRNRLGRWPIIVGINSGGTNESGDRPDLRWPYVTAVVVTSPELLSQIYRMEPYRHWQVHRFATVTVLTRPG